MRGGSILLVEDEALVLMDLETVLTEAGFSVDSCMSAGEAISRLADTHIALVTDIRLGSGEDGWEIARRAREENPGIAVVYMSGDSAGDWTARGVPESVMLKKPFASAQLVMAVAGLINDSPVEED
jgi:DNA-binding response OmpR family regulator